MMYKMTSMKQIEANKRNAMRSTGPVSEQGKSRSRCNAVRHGLTAETVIGTLEDAQDYKAFEAAIIADHDAQSAVERELVLRLASLFWRLRRATLMETSLFDIQASHVHSLRQGRTKPHATLCARNLERAEADFSWQDSHKVDVTERETDRSKERHPSVQLAHCFLRLANLPSYPLDRLSRYEATIWRQAAQIMLTLDLMKRRGVG
jgi:hypothetical protein